MKVEKLSLRQYAGIDNHLQSSHTVCVMWVGINYQLDMASNGIPIEAWIWKNIYFSQVSDKQVLNGFSSLITWHVAQHLSSM